MAEQTAELYIYTVLQAGVKLNFLFSELSFKLGWFSI